MRVSIRARARPIRDQPRMSNICLSCSVLLHMETQSPVISTTRFMSSTDSEPSRSVWLSISGSSRLHARPMFLAVSRLSPVSILEGPRN